MKNTLLCCSIVGPFLFKVFAFVVCVCVRVRCVNVFVYACVCEGYVSVRVHVWRHLSVVLPCPFALCETDGLCLCVTQAHWPSSFCSLVSASHLPKSACWDDRQTRVHLPGDQGSKLKLSGSCGRSFYPQSHFHSRGHLIWSSTCGHVSL